MATIQYRPELNPLTTPASYKLRFVHQGIGGYNELAARLALKNPTLSVDMIKSMLMQANDEIGLMLAEGMQVTLENAFTYRPSLRARLDTPDDLLPPMDELLQVSISASQHFVKTLQKAAHLKCLPPEEKSPVILSATDINWELNDVLNSDSVLRLSGNNLFFDKKKPDCGCVIEGTHNGKVIQTQFANISDKEILLVPNFQAQTSQWNNEYTLSVSTQYTENGSLRTGTYSRKLRSPLVLYGFSNPTPTEVGMLTGSADAAYVKATAAEMSAHEMLRIQAVLNLATDQLSLSLLAMQEHSAVGDAVSISGNGGYTLPGFSGSAVSSLTIRVDNYAGLVALIRSSYLGRMVDILDMTM